MGKVEKRIGIINASFFRGEVTEIVTISLTTDGKFELISTDEMEFTDAMDFIDHIEKLHRANPYSAFVMDAYGVNEGVMVAMRNSGLPVISIEDMFLAIGAKIDCDIINSTPNLYTPRPENVDVGVLQDRMEIGEHIQISTCGRRLLCGGNSYE